MATVVEAPARQAPSLQGFLQEYERTYPDEVVHLEQPVNVALELSALAAKLEKAKRFPVVVCHKPHVNGVPMELPLVTFLMASRLRLARVLDSDVRTAGLALYEGVQRRQKPVVVSRHEAPVKELVQTGAEIDLRRLPAPIHHGSDPGQYVTQGLFLSFNRETGRDNSALQRGWIAGRDELRVLLSTHSHNWRNLRQYEAADEDMPAAYWVGHHPLAVLGAQTHVGPDDSHYETAGGLLNAPLRLVPSETLGNDFLVPADAEVVIEGYVPKNQRKPEGPFGEYTRYIGPQRWNPFMKVTAVTRRRNAYWEDCMEGHTHWISSLVREGSIFRDVRQVVAGVKAAHVPMSGCGVHVYIQMKKTVEGQAKTAAIAALMSTVGNKHVFVFDEDVDIFDEKEVLQALAWRFQGDRDLLLMKGVDGSFLDPSLPDDRVVTKVGFDCTKPLGKPFAERLAVPEDVMARVDPEEFLGKDVFDRIPVEPWG